MNTGTANGADAGVSGGTVRVGFAAGEANGFAGRIDFPGRAGNGFLTINGNDYTVLNSLGVAGDATTTTLQGMNGNLGGYYALGSNIDAAATSTWNSGAGFAPVGDGSYVFTGTFDGLGHTISNLVINRPTTNYVGLLGDVSLGTSVRNIGMVGGSVSGSYATGGFVGYNGGTISNAYATGSASGGDLTGGLVGYNSGTITNAYATGSVSGSSRTGGFVGFNFDKISNAYYDVDQVLINGAHKVTVGGIYHAQFQDWLTHGQALSIANYAVSLPLSSDGYYQISSLQGLKDLLGFAGQDNSYKFRLTQNLNLATLSEWYIPIFAASNTLDGDNHVLDHFSLSRPDEHIIGLIGNNSGILTRIGLTNSLVTGYQATGGLVGVNSGTISNAYCTGSVSGTYYTGGLVGYNVGTISNAYASSSVSGDFTAGGLVGENSGTISDAYATSSVSGSHRTGGLAGLNYYGTISNAYATGQVSGSAYTGGFVGVNDHGTIGNVYSVGWVSGSFDIGGLAGLNFYGTISKAYWNFETSGQARSSGGTGKTTAELNNLATFGGWDFTNTWQISAGNYPMLRSTQQLISYYDLTVSGGRYTRLYGSNNPVFTPIFSGLVSGDSGTFLGALWSTEATINSNIGTYVISGSGPSTYAINGHSYTVTYVNGSLTINPAVLTVSAIADTKTYDGTTASSAAPRVSGLASKDSVLATQVFDSANAGTRKLSVSGITINDGNDGKNYTVAINSKSATGKINPAALTIAAVSATKVDDDTKTSDVTPAAIGLISKDSFTATQVFNSANAGERTLSVSSYSINDGNNGKNYTVTKTTATGTITPAPLTITATSATKTYDATTKSTATPVITGLKGNDAAKAVEVFDSVNAGDRNLLIGSYSISDSNGGKNYTVTQQSAAGHINPAALAIAAVTASKTFDGTTSSTAKPKVSGLKSKDKAAATETFDSAAAGSRTLSVNAYSITDGNNGGNYVVTTSTAAGTIKAK